MIIALIPTYGSRGYLDNMLEWLNCSQQVDAIEILSQEKPLGSAMARNNLIQQATAKYGYDHHYLMLDDDCVFSNHSHIRKASTIIDIEKDIGLVSFPLGGCVTAGYAESVIVKHCWLINGKLLADGANYTPGELYDSADLSLQSYLLGYRNVITREAIIWHDVSITHSIRFRLLNEGKIMVKSSIAERYAQYIASYKEGYFIKLNDTAHTDHQKHNKHLKQKYGQNSN